MPSNLVLPEDRQVYRQVDPSTGECGNTAFTVQGNIVTSTTEQEVHE